MKGIVMGDILNKARPALMAAMGQIETLEAEHLRLQQLLADQQGRTSGLAVTLAQCLDQLIKMKDLVADRDGQLARVMGDADYTLNRSQWATGIRLAFYHAAKGDWQDGLIGAVTRGLYSHVELLLEPPQLGLTHCISASGRDGGVRAKEIDLGSGKWDVVHFECADAQAVTAFVKGQLGKPYDLRGALLSPFRHAGAGCTCRTCVIPDAWFCSQLIASAMQMFLPQAIHPNALWRDVMSFGGRRIRLPSLPTTETLRE